MGGLRNDRATTTRATATAKTMKGNHGRSLRAIDAPGAEIGALTPSLIVRPAVRLPQGKPLPTSHHRPALGYPQPVPTFKGVSAVRSPPFPSSASTTMITVDSLRGRAARLQQLNIGLVGEVARWKGAESPLVDAERKRT